MTPSRTALTVVQQVPVTAADRAAALYAEARQAASDHAQELFNSMSETMRLADEVGRGSDAYPAGLRDLARRLAVNLKATGDTMASVTGIRS